MDHVPEDPPVDDGHLAVPPRNTTPQSTRPSEVSDSNDQENLGAPAPQLNNEPAINRPHGNEDQRGNVEPQGENDQIERENNYNPPPRVIVTKANDSEREEPEDP
ncbi:hypothetical protein CAEBREN_18195 [Caenorhabditis brenneri]|uniref:Uncharacterized protein n=1 Tax=Caenorhabditis brenneri TaxID=135651 RepID=G0NFL4_CAEBE|nr:hypothetical protein CAEBREN_18195 [Caenorhabditis brenneri]